MWYGDDYYKVILFKVNIRSSYYCTLIAQNNRAHNAIYAHVCNVLLPYFH